MVEDVLSSRIKESGFSIYDPLVDDNSSLFIPTKKLEELLDKHLNGLNLQNLPLRTRSKVIKTNVCNALGYPVPSSFKKTQPRFPAQLFDVYVQKSNNLQIWNEEISPVRRYVLIGLSAEDIVERVRVVDGADLVGLDTTGTLTHKYQAQMLTSSVSSLLSPLDTIGLRSVLKSEAERTISNPDDFPTTRSLMPIEEIFIRLDKLVGKTFTDSGITRERSRGDILHNKVSTLLGYKSHHDNGQFPDIRNQLLEVKLQSSPTIDLGMVKPDSSNKLDFPNLGEYSSSHRDVRYAIFGTQIENNILTITKLFLVTGEDFFKNFRQFKGKVKNKKLQIPLPRNFFAR